MPDGGDHSDVDRDKAADVLAALAEVLSVGHDVRNGDSRDNIAKQVRGLADSLRGGPPSSIDREAIADWKRTLEGILHGE